MTTMPSSSSDSSTALNFTYGLWWRIACAKRIEILVSRSDSDDHLLAAHRQLIERAVVTPLSDNGDDTRRWLGCELASLIEGHLHLIVDVDALSPVERSTWERRVTGEGERLLDPRTDKFRRPYWLLYGNDRAGTLAIESQLLGRSDVSISSLYVRPDLRRRGIASRALAAAHAAVVSAGADGLLISANWCWQHAVRFYARLGLWVRSWKHSLVFVRRDDLWPYRVEIDGVTAKYSVFCEGTWTPLLEAENRRAVLGWTELPAYAALRERFDQAHLLAPGTFALHLALAGWPLVRAAELWERREWWSDVGMPEGLAYKITVFEEIARASGYDVRTPHIPGVEYGPVAERATLGR